LQVSALTTIPTSIQAIIDLAAAQVIFVNDNYINLVALRPYQINTELSTKPHNYGKRDICSTKELQLRK
jgi:hypothetical protein